MISDVLYPKPTTAATVGTVDVADVSDEEDSDIYNDEDCNYDDSQEGVIHDCQNL